MICGIRGTRGARGLTEVGRDRSAEHRDGEGEGQQAVGHVLFSIGERRVQAHSDTRLSRSAFVMTDTELRLMAAAAIIGDSSSPKKG